MDPPCTSESIYNLIPSDLKEPPQPPRYTSVFRASIKDDLKKFKTAMKTMGPAKVELPSPKEFLKKHSKEKMLPPKKKFNKRLSKMPAVPLRTDHPVMGIQSGKNFINTNAADVIVGVAKKPKPIYVDRRTGDKHDLETSGLLPKYINKKDYGITPEYICKRNEDVKKAQEEYNNCIQENLEKAALKRLSDEEREAVLQAPLWRTVETCPDFLMKDQGKQSSFEDFSSGHISCAIKSCADPPPPVRELNLSDCGLCLSPSRSLL
ncbi:enkurin isoform X1 [Psammomys obesus]|uniref:enkurin isoform X1 n=1 Tax=Psammomys obesus TaxID=48139 RepID=UPI0024532FBF|nr:enkurin isoform X1 [Psammomys obesus]